MIFGEIMRKKYEVYKCEVCGNIVQIMHGSVGTLVCCNKSMRLLEGLSDSEGSEKHIPIIEKTPEGIMVKVGSIPHPMEEYHYIEWIEIIIGDNIYRKHLSPGSNPQARFNLSEDDLKEGIIAREFCTVHGMWQG
jgi:superoxide reductase